MSRDSTNDGIGIDQIKTVNEMEEEDLDSLPFGVIRLNREGTILSYNRGEEQIAGRVKSDVVGKNFFTEVAPCTNVRDFAGRYREGVEAGSLHTVFPFRFDYEMSPRNVTITLFYSDATETGWVFVRNTPN